MALFLNTSLRRQLHRLICHLSSHLSHLLEDMVVLQLMEAVVFLLLVAMVVLLLEALHLADLVALPPVECLLQLTEVPAILASINPKSTSNLTCTHQRCSLCNLLPMIKASQVTLMLAFRKESLSFLQLADRPLAEMQTTSRRVLMPLKTCEQKRDHSGVKMHNSNKILIAR